MSLTSNDVQWIVLDDGDIAVKIGDAIFSCYKGKSIQCGVYAGDSIYYRPMVKRECGESLSRKHLHPEILECYPVDEVVDDKWFKLQPENEVNYND